jgi:flavin-binding protein dodecin
MSEHSYGISEIVGSSTDSTDDAIRNAIAKATQDRRHIRWFEVKELRGHVEDGKVAHYQATLKLGYTLEE